MKSTRIQQDADMIIREFKKDYLAVLREEPAHGLPLRIDRNSDKNTWTFDDRYKISLG